MLKPPFPPNRIYKDSFGFLIETKESILATKIWKINMVNCRAGKFIKVL